MFFPAGFHADSVNVLERSEWRCYQSIHRPAGFNVRAASRFSDLHFVK
jgi:hypothetical protein